MNTLEQDLNRLGQTDDSVTQKLRLLGVKGKRCHPYCPIFNYLRQLGHTEVRSVDLGGIEYSDEDGGHLYPPPAPVERFITRFDKGEFADLEDT